MSKIFESIGNTEKVRKYRFSKKNSIAFKEGIEVTLDFTNKEFTVKAISSFDSALDNSWKVYEDTTFPSSLLREFLENI